MRTIALLLLLASTCFAQVEVDVVKSQVITGLKNPRLVAGVIVLAEGSKPTTGEAAFIQVKTEIPAQNIIVEAQQSLFDFAQVDKTGEYEWMVIGTGKYLITVDAWSPETGRVRERREIVLGPVVDPGPIDPGEPPPSQGFADVAQASKAAAAAVADPPTAADLNKSILARASVIAPTMPLANARVAMSVEIENALFRRQGVSRDKNWVDLWRKPMEAAIRKAETDGRIKTTANYLEAMKAVAEGLK